MNGWGGQMPKKVQTNQITDKKQNKKPRRFCSVLFFLFFNLTIGNH